jgi:hypothetical protein
MKSRIVLLALALAGAGLLSAEAQKTTIRVVVTNQYDKPVENAAVILDFLGSRDITRAGFRKKIHWEVRTNQEGKAHFPPIPEGKVQLQITNKNYQTFGEKVDIEGEEKVLNIKLEPPQKQYSAHPALKPADPPKK